MTNGCRGPVTRFERCFHRFPFGARRAWRLARVWCFKLVEAYASRVPSGRHEARGPWGRAHAVAHEEGVTVQHAEGCARNTQTEEVKFSCLPEICAGHIENRRVESCSGRSQRCRRSDDKCLRGW
jgi:hypothetical protein